MRHLSSFVLLSATLTLGGLLEAQTRATRTPSIRRTGNTTAPQTAANAATSTTEVAQQLAKAERGKGGRPKLKFDNAPAELFLQIYSQVTHRTLLTSPDIPKVTMSLRSTDEEHWSDDEYIQAIEQQLQLNGIGLIPVGERFALVVPFKSIGQQGIETFMEIPPSGRHPEEGRIVRQILTPKNVSAEEVQKVVEGFKRPDGQIQYLERTNSLLITDTQENVNRMIEILAFIDKPMPVLEEVQVYPIRYAKAEDIKKALEEFVEASREQDEKSKKSTAAPRLGNSISGGMQRGVSIQRQLPGVTRAGAPAEEASSSVSDALVNDADRGMIRGKVQIMADARSNQLIIVTRPSNMAFFERIIKVLDIETAPEIAVEIIRLKYAQAETKDSNKGVADLLNDLIDSTSSKKEDSDNRNSTANASKSNLTNQNTPTPAPQVNLSSSSKSKIGELRKENIKILADGRINAVMVMASPGDLAAIKDIIAEMDIPVAQVLIETVVLNVSLGEGFATGVQWIKNIHGSQTLTGGGIPSGVSPSVGPVSNNKISYQNEYTKGTSTSSDESSGEIVTQDLTKMIPAASGGASYYATFGKLGLDLLVAATENDSRAQILTSPILMTQDNKEATIESTELAYLYNGMKYMGSSYGSSGSDYQPDVKQEEIGLHITVTPRINPDGTVVLDFEEEFQDASKTQKVPGDTSSGAGGDWPVPTTRKISGSVAVKDGQTVVIGGLVMQTKTESEGGIPILRHIPYIGKYLFGYTEYKDNRDELLVFLTPYVFYTSEEAQEEAQRRKDYLDATGVWNKGWSKSDLADMTDEEDMLRRDNNRRKYETRQYAAKQKRTEAQRTHDRKMEKMLKDSIRRKREMLEDEYEDLPEAERKEIEKEIEDERIMHRALLKDIMESNAAEQEATEQESAE